MYYCLHRCGFKPQFEFGAVCSWAPPGCEVFLVTACHERRQGEHLQGEHRAHTEPPSSSARASPRLSLNHRPSTVFTVLFSANETGAESLVYPGLKPPTLRSTNTFKMTYGDMVAEAIFNLKIRNGEIDTETHAPDENTSVGFSIFSLPVLFLPCRCISQRDQEVHP